MGSSVNMDINPRFKAKVVGSFKQLPGCPDYVVETLEAKRLEKMSLGECYHPSDERYLIDRIEVVQPGRVMRVDFQAHELFEDDKAEVRSIRTNLLDRTMGSLSANPPGFRFEMAFLIGSPLSDDNNLPVIQTLELARAGAFARKVIERGAPPHAVSVGIIPGKPTDVSLYFYVREESAARLQFDLPIGEELIYDDSEVAQPDLLPSAAGNLIQSVPDADTPTSLNPEGEVE